MSRKGEAEPHEPRRVLRLAEPCRDAQGCVEIHRKLLPQHPPPSATDPGGHLENIRNVTRRLPRAAGSRRAGCLLPCGILFLFSPLCCSLQYVTGIWEPSPDTRLALVILNVGWLVLQRLIPVRERSRCNTLLLLQPSREPGWNTWGLFVFQRQNKLMPELPGAITSCLFARAGNNTGSIWCQSSCQTPLCLM